MHLKRINWHTQHVCIMLHNFRLLMGSPGTLDNRPPKQGNLKCSNTTCSNKKIFYEKCMPVLANIAWSLGYETGVFWRLIKQLNRKTLYFKILD